LKIEREAERRQKTFQSARENVLQLENKETQLAQNKEAKIKDKHQEMT